MLTPGFIKLYRDVRESRFWPKHGQRYSVFEALIDLRMEARFKPGIVMRGGVSIHVPVGGLVVTQVGLAQRWRWDRKTVNKFLTVLIDCKMVHVETRRGVDNGYTLITFLKLSDFETPTDDEFPIEYGNDLPIESP